MASYRSLKVKCVVCGFWEVLAYRADTGPVGIHCAAVEDESAAPTN